MKDKDEKIQGIRAREGRLGCGKKKFVIWLRFDKVMGIYVLGG